MSQAKALLWKEWHEVRGYLALALFVFLCLPLIGAVEDVIVRHRFVLAASPWVYLLGGVLAVFVGVGTVVRDLDGRLEEFWRSRPVSATRWLIVKYFVGLLVVLAGLVVPLVVELVVNRGRALLETDARVILAWGPFFWAAVYSVSFAAGCLFRRGAHAAMISIALVLLIYFLPQVIPPLKFLSLDQVIDESRFPRTDSSGRVLEIYRQIAWIPWTVRYEPRQLTFVAGMAVLCAAALFFALAAVWRDWRAESGRRTIYWTIGGALLILFSSAAFQVASNLPLLQTLELPSGRWTQLMRANGDDGVIVLEGPFPAASRVPTLLRPFHATASGVELAAAAEVDVQLSWWRLVFNPDHPNILYIPEENEPAGGARTFPSLTTVTISPGGGADVAVQSFPEFAIEKGAGTRDWFTTGMIWNGRLYLVGPKVMTFDLADPQRPRLVSTEAYEWDFRSRRYETWRLFDPNENVDAATVLLPIIPQLPPRKRLELALDLTTYRLLSGDVLVRINDAGIITTYHLDQLTENSATFRRLGRYDPTPVQRLFGVSGRSGKVGDGLLFQTFSNGQLGGAHVAVFDITGPRPVPVAHFALPHETGLQAMCPLPGGRLLAAGRDRLYLLGPPPGIELPRVTR